MLTLMAVKPLTELSVLTSTSATSRRRVSKRVVSTETAAGTAAAIASTSRCHLIMSARGAVGIIACTKATDVLSTGSATAQACMLV